MLKRLLTLLVVTCLFAFGCKKSDGGNGPPIVNTIATGDPSGAYNGVFMKLYYGSSPISINASAFFYAQPTQFKFRTLPAVTTLPTALAGTVSVNGINLNLDPSDSLYSDTGNTFNFPPAIWQVSGSTLIPALAYTCATPFPFFNTSSIPSTINLSQSLGISMSGTSGYDQVEFSITDANDNYFGSMTSGTYSTVTLPKDSLARFVPTTNAIFDVVLIKYSPKKISGKDFLFATFYSYSKTVTLQ